MGRLKSTAATSMLMALISCGGGTDAVTSPPTPPDREAPVVTAVTMAPGESGNTVMVNEGVPSIQIQVLQAGDNIDVTAYCITSNATPPAAKSSCFSEERSSVRAIGPAWHVWARDAAGNVSTAYRAPGPCSDAAVAAAQASSLPTVCMRTDVGDIVIELDNIKAPISSNNFAQYVTDGFYAGTIFHRVLSGSVIQGGGFSSLDDVSANKTKTARSAISIERTTQTTLSNVEKTIVMARTSPDADSATSQFFINLRDNSADYDANDARANTSANPTAKDGYAVFGRVIYGYDEAVSAIAKLPLSGNRPTQSIFIQWAYLLN